VPEYNAGKDYMPEKLILRLVWKNKGFRIARKNLQSE
jgi:hypothetical protein